MPYLKKGELKWALTAAFNEGVLAGIAIDHNENTPEMIFGTFDFDSFYQKHYLKQDNCGKTSEVNE